MTTWGTEVGSAPAYWMAPADSLPAAETVLEAIRAEPLTKVVDEVEAALALAQRFAVEYGAEGAVVLVTGRPEFVVAVTVLVS